MNALNKARAVLERDGWGQGDYETGDGKHCAIGALAAIKLVGATMDELRAVPYGKVANFLHAEVEIEALAEVICEQYPDMHSISMEAPVHSVINFNDSPDVSKEDVIAIFEKAAVKLNEQHS